MVLFLAMFLTYRCFRELNHGAFVAVMGRWGTTGEQLVIYNIKYKKYTNNKNTGWLLLI